MGDDYTISKADYERLRKDSETLRTLRGAAKRFLARRIEIFPNVRGADNCKALHDLQAAVEKR